MPDIPLPPPTEHCTPSMPCEACRIRLAIQAVRTEQLTCPVCNVPVAQLPAGHWLTTGTDASTWCGNPGDAPDFLAWTDQLGQP